MHREIENVGPSVTGFMVAPPWPAEGAPDRRFTQGPPVGSRQSSGKGNGAVALERRRPDHEDHKPCPC